MSENIVQRVKEDIDIILENLVSYRLNGEAFHYATAISSLSILVNILRKEDGIGRHHELGYALSLMDSIKKEISSVSALLDSAILDVDPKHYKDDLVAFERLLDIFRKISDDVNPPMHAREESSVNRYIMMYRGFDDKQEHEVYKYLKGFYDELVFVNGDGELWVAEEVFHHVFAIINAWAIFNEDAQAEGFEVYSLEDSQQWMDQQLQWMDEQSRWMK